MAGYTPSGAVTTRSYRSVDAELVRKDALKETIEKIKSGYGGERKKPTSASMQRI
jgi:hypothetical protein